MYAKFIKLILPSSPFFEIPLPSDEGAECVYCDNCRPENSLSICLGATVCHDYSLRRFRHGNAWWIELSLPCQRHRSVVKL